MGEVELIEALTDAVGASRVLTAAGDTGPYLVDERRRFEGAAIAVVQPATPQEVAAVVSACAASGVPVVPQGGNTGLCGGATAPTDGSAIVLSLERLRTVRSVDPANHTLTVDAGVTVAGAAEAAERAGRLFPLRFGAEGTAQIGGALSTNAGGTAVLRYGSARDLTLGVEAVLADGRIYSDLAGLRKDNTGYALSDLFVGAEGTLGVITGATLRLFPRPVQKVTALVAPTSVPSAIELLAKARAATDDRLVAFEWMGLGSLELLDRKRPLAEWADQLVLLEATSGSHADELSAAIETLLSQALADGIVHDASVARSAADREVFWSIRDGIPEAEKQAGGSLKHDVSVAVDDVTEMLDLATDAVGQLAPAAKVSAFGHLGDGNIHFNLLGHDRCQEAAITRSVFDVVSELGGSFSAEHGVGRLRRDELARRANPVGLELMRSIKDALDPDGLMNPGAVL